LPEGGVEVGNGQKEQLLKGKVLAAFSAVASGKVARDIGFARVHIPGGKLSAEIFHHVTGFPAAEFHFQPCHGGFKSVRLHLFAVKGYQEMKNLVNQAHGVELPRLDKPVRVFCRIYPGV